MAREWAPNRLPYIVLTCGEIELSWPEVRRDRKTWYWCPTHKTLENSKRVATLTDISKWLEEKEGRLF